MVLSVAERKDRLPYGAQQEVARSEKVSVTYVSLTMSGDMRPKTKRAQLRLRRVQRALAKKLGVTLEEAFPEINQEMAKAS